MSAIDRVRTGKPPVKPLPERINDAYSFLARNDRLPPIEELFYQVNDNRFAEGDIVSAIQQKEFQIGFPDKAIWLPRENEQFRFPVEVCIAKTHWLTNSYKSTFEDLIFGISKIGGVCPYGALPLVLYNNPNFIHKNEQMVAVSSSEVGSLFLTASRNSGFGCASILFRPSVHLLEGILPPDTLWMFAV